jgi:hypothetical protein
MSDAPQTEPERDDGAGGRAEPLVGRRSEADAAGMWYCPECDSFVPPECVTYEETHDPRYGGCGTAVE